jgi:hypothetical protein
MDARVKPGHDTEFLPRSRSFAVWHDSHALAGNRFLPLDQIKILCL